MLETERHDKESDNDKTTGAGHTGGVTPDPAEAGEGTDQADPGSKETGGHGRRLFRRGRRAATRPAGPPGEDLGSGSDPADGGAFAVPAQAPPVPAPAFTSAPAAPGAGAAESGTSSPAETGDDGPPASASPQTPQAPPQPTFQPPLVIFHPPDISAGGAHRPAPGGASPAEADAPGEASTGGDEPDDDGAAGSSPAKRRRRGGRGHAKGRGAADTGAGEDTGRDSEAPEDGEDDLVRSGPRASDGDAAAADSSSAETANGEDTAAGAEATARRRRRRRRSGHSADADAPASDDPPNTVVHVRATRAAGEDGSDVKGVKGSTRLEAKRQRRREGRESGRRRPPIITESEFLARREAVERVMVVRQHDDRTQIAVLEDGILVEHYVDKASHQSYVGNVYLGRVQNVLPSMEAAFVDIGKGRNAVLYAGEVNFDASGLEGESKRIESALKSGQSILVQATKDPIGHKGARLTSQVSLPGRYLVYVPGASMTGISRKLPDTERTRLKQILKQVMPEDAGVIVRTAAEGATEEELSHDVARLAAQWEAIERKAKSATAPELLYSEPDLTIRVVRDIFNEDFTKLVIASDGDWDMVDEYVRYVAPSLAERLERWTGDGDVFAAYRIDEQIAKALERKVWLPSGGSLVIDTTEAMTVIDVNTGKFTGQGGNLEQTVTRNNLEAAEEIVRQLRVRDVGGIIVIDFIDMVLESNRDLVLRRLLECLARDRTKHQVAEVTSLGLVQMTRKRVGSGLLEAFSVPCDCCNGRGVIVSLDPVDHAPSGDRPARDGDRPARDGGRPGGPRAGSGRGAGRGSAGGTKGRPAGGTEADPAARPPGQADGEPAEQERADGAAAHDDMPGGDAARGDAAAGDAAAGRDGAGSRPASGGRRRRRSGGSGGSSGTQADADAQNVAGTQAVAGTHAMVGSDAPDAQAMVGAGAPEVQAMVGAGAPEVRAVSSAHDVPGAPGAEKSDAASPAGADAPGADAPGVGGASQDGEAGPNAAAQDGTREAQTTAG
jgi:ribonuclease E